MSGLFASLNSTVQAMGAHSRSLEIAGKNLANVNNAGYARQRVIYGDRGTIVTPNGAESLGLEAIGVEQIRDQLLDRQVLRESSLSAYYTAMQSGYQRAQAGLGQTISGTSSTSSGSSSTDTGIAAALDDFFNSFQALAANPTDTGQRQSLIQATAILTDRVQLADSRLEQVQSDLDAQIDSDVGTANTLLASIAELNDQIARFEVNSPGSAVDLRDQRQTALEKLAAKLPITVTDTTGGMVAVSVKDTLGNAVLLVDNITVANPVAYDGTKVTAGTPAVDLALSSGSIQGSLDARNGAVQSLRDNLDAFASQLATSVNAAYGGDYFADPGTVTAGTLALDAGITASSLTAGTGTAGDNSIAKAIADIASQKFSVAGGDEIDGTLSGFFSTSVSELGQALSGANARVTDQSNIELLVRSQRDAVSGVNLDEEMADLMKFQRAFQASSRVFTVIDDMLDVVVNQLGR